MRQQLRSQRTFVRPTLRALTALGVGAVFVVVSVSAAHATAPGRNGRIAFRRYLNAAHTRGEIFTIKSDGAGMRQLTHSPGNLSTEPDWSPNGRRIAYELRPRGNEERARILTIRANGHDRTSLGRSCTGLCRADGFPAWSPHGKRIAVQRSLGKRPLIAIFVMRANGTHARQITLKRADPSARQPFDDLAPAWAPSGRRLAFERYRYHPANHAIFTVRLDGSGLRRITPWSLDAAQPDYAPDGGEILFRSNTTEKPGKPRNLWLVHPDGSGLHAVTHDSAGTAVWGSSSFSPNGRRVTASRSPVVPGVEQNADVYTLDRDGSDLRNLTNTPNLFESAPDWGSKPR